MSIQRRIPVKQFIIFWIIMVVGVIVLSFSQPLITSILFIGPPLIFSPGNLWDERNRSDRFKRNIKA